MIWGKNYPLAVAFAFCNFRRGIFSNLFINGHAFIISGRKKMQFFLSIVQGKDVNYKQSAVLLYWYVKTIMKHIWNHGCNYQSAVDNYLSAERNGNGQNRPKIGSKPKTILLVHQVQLSNFLWEKKFTIPLSMIGILVRLPI